MGVEFNSSNYEDQLAIIRAQQEAQRAANEQRAEEQKTTEEVKATIPSTAEREVLKASPYPDTRLTAADFSNPVINDKPKEVAVFWKQAGGEQLAGLRDDFAIFFKGGATVAKKDTPGSTEAKPNELALNAFESFTKTAADSLGQAQNFLTSDTGKFIGTVAEYLKEDEKKAEFLKIWANPDAPKEDKIQEGAKFLIKEFHDKPDALKDIIRAGLDLKDTGLSDSRKALIAEYGAEFISKIPEDKLSSVTDLASRIISQGIDPMEIVADPSKLGAKIEMSASEVSRAQRAVADATLATLEAHGVDTKALAALLDPKHPDSIVDASGNINTTKLSQELMRQAIYEAQSPEEQQIRNQANAELNAQSIARSGRTIDQNIAKLQRAQNSFLGRLFGSEQIAEGWAKVNQGLATRDATVASEIQKQLQSSLPAASQEQAQFLQGLFSRSSLGSPIDIETKTTSNDPRFSFYSSDTGKYAVYEANNGLYNGKPLVYQYDSEKNATRVDDDLARRIYQQTQNWNNSVERLRSPSQVDPNYNQYNLNNGSIVALHNTDSNTAYRYNEEAKQWQKLSSAESQTLAARARGISSGFADPTVDVRIADLQRLGRTVTALIPEDLTARKSSANDGGVQVYKGANGQSLYYEVTNADALKGANEKFKNSTSIENGRIAVYENNQWVFVPKTDTARLARIQNSMRFADKARP